MGEGDERFFDHSAPLAVVTGASSGMGLAIARRLADRGHRLILISRDPQRLDELSRRWVGGAPHLPLAVDLCDLDAIAAKVEPLLRRAGPPAVLVNAAGSGIFKPMLQQTSAQHLRLWQINYLATYELIRLALPAMLAADRGHVINIASMSSKMGPWGHAGYAGAKSAVVSLTQTLAAEHHDSGVRFSYINPGIVDTPFFTKPGTQGLWSVVHRRAVSPEAIADGVESLLARPRLELCVPGHYRLLDFIHAISVEWAHRLVRRGSSPHAQTTDVAVPGEQPASESR
jgi:hypothetical protein